MAISTKCMNKANDKGFKRRVKYFMQKAATSVLGESFGGGGEPSEDEHTTRVIYAKKVLDGIASIYEFSVGVVNNPTVAAKIDADNAPTDSELEYTANSLFSDFSGWDQ